MSDNQNQDNFDNLIGSDAKQKEMEQEAKTWAESKT